jgi:GT2 family glycosyltransferase
MSLAKFDDAVVALPATCGPPCTARSLTTDPTSAKSVSVAAVVVTYNRLALLRECVAALRAQDRPVDEIIIVNNGSTDGTGEWLATQTELTVISQENSGSAGGQFTGIKLAYENGHDWFWCMDDDTIPVSGALAAFEGSRPFRSPSTGFLWSRILKPNGEVDQALATTDQFDWWGTVCQDHCIRVDHATFVSVMISRPAVQTVGLPLRWMFIWGEDFEYTRRIAGKFKGWVVLDSDAVHKTVSKPAHADPYADNGFRERSLYRIRNEIVRVRIDPFIGGFGRLQGLTNAFYQALRLMLRRKMPLKTILWMSDGLFRGIRFEYPAEK